MNLTVRYKAFKVVTLKIAISWDVIKFHGITSKRVIIRSLIGLLINILLHYIISTKSLNVNPSMFSAYEHFSHQVNSSISPAAHIIQSKVCFRILLIYIIYKISPCITVFVFSFHFFLSMVKKRMPTRFQSVSTMTLQTVVLTDYNTVKFKKLLAAIMVRVLN